LENSFHFPVRVYYEDTDAGGVVFYANYLKFFERARTEWLRHLGVSQTALAGSDRLIFIVVNTQLRYRSPARLDDLLDIRSRITKMGAASVHFEQVAQRDGTRLVESQIQVCCVNADTFRPTPIPTPIRQLFPFVQD